MSATIESSGPVTFASAILAVALRTESTVIAALRPSSVECVSPAVLKVCLRSVET